MLCANSSPEVVDCCSELSLESSAASDDLSADDSDDDPDDGSEVAPALIDLDASDSFVPALRCFFLFGTFL